MFCRSGADDRYRYARCTVRTVRTSGGTVSPFLYGTVRTAGTVPVLRNVPVYGTGHHHTNIFILFITVYVCWGQW